MSPRSSPEQTARAVSSREGPRERWKLGLDKVSHLDRTELAKKKTLTQGPPREIPSILPVRVANQNEGFASSCSRVDLAI